MKNTNGNNSKFAVTIDLDWASEEAIEVTLSYFESREIPVTVFSTHDSALIRSKIYSLEIGVHPYFDLNSSHGNHIEETIATVLELPHNIKSYRCHRFTLSNEIQSAMQRAGMICSSNVCTNLEVVKPFFNRFNTLEIPIFMEDGAFLYNRHSLSINTYMRNLITSEGLKTIVIHPMHFVVNTPNWEYMVNIKESMDRKKWNNLSLMEISNLKFKGRGITNFFDEFFEELNRLNIKYVTIGNVMNFLLKTRQVSYIFD